MRRNTSLPVTIGWEAQHCLQRCRRISFQRRKTGKESPKTAFDPELARVEYAISGFGQIWAVGLPGSLSRRGGSESDRVAPDLDQRLGLASKPIAKR